MTRNKKPLIILILIIASGCSSPASQPTTNITAGASPTETAALTPTAVAAQTQPASSIATLTRTPQPTVPTATITPTSTSTPTPTRFPVPPLTKHEFTPAPILVRLWIASGNGGSQVDSPPEIVVYGNGEMIIVQDPPLYRKLPRQDICRLLNTIDQTGYFELDQYINEHLFNGGNMTHISVQAWRSNSTVHNNLQRHIDGSLEPYYGKIYIPEALVETYLLLDNYNPGDMEYYETDRSVVWVFSRENVSEAIPWPLPNLPLKNLRAENSINDITLPFIMSKIELPDGAEELPTGYFVEDGIYYLVYTRPLWPYEIIDENNRLVDLGPAASELIDSISCKVSDGLLPIPTPPP